MTEAQYYRRFVLQQRIAERKSGVGTGGVRERSIDSIGRAPRGLNEGKGFVFISHKGRPFRAAFFPSQPASVSRNWPRSIVLSAFPAFARRIEVGGNVRFLRIQRDLRGSRARAHALTGNPHAEEPCCSYVPKGYVQPAPE